MLGGSIAETSKSPIKKILSGLGFAFVCFLILAMFIWRASVFRITKNLYEVAPGKIYRSAQMTPQEMEEAIKKYGIKSVVSVRGAAKKSFWVPGELQVLQNLGVKFYSYFWTTDYFPDKMELVSFLQDLKKMELPVLIHCKTGADRTGAATAIYAIEVLGESKEAALENHLNFKYWHVRSLHPYMAELIRRYQGLDWMISNYDHCSAEFKDGAHPGHCP